MGACVCNKSRPKGETKHSRAHAKKHTKEDAKEPQMRLTEELDDCIIKENIQKYYKLGKNIGFGQFGVVKMAQRIVSQDSYNFAVKSIPKSKIGKKVILLERELTLLMQVDHPNIIKLYEIFDDQKYIHLVMEYCSGGELFDQLSVRGKYTEGEAAKIMYSLLHAVSHLHSLNISHRDLKPENIMLSTNSPDGEIKLVDFGFAKFIDEPGTLNTIVGTPYYVAPEVLKKQYGLSCDIWSLGVIMYMLLLGLPPFAGENPQSVINRVLTGKFDTNTAEWELLSEPAKDLISKMICTSIHDRIEAKEALEHPWLNNRMERNTKKIDKHILKRLRRTESMNQFKRETMNILIRFLHSEEIYQLNNIFRSLDKDHTGSITPLELRDGLIQAGLDVGSDELHRIIEYADQNRRGTIEYSEFLSVTLNRKCLNDKSALWLAFKTFDLDNSGGITKDNLRLAMKRAGWCLTEEELQVIITEKSLHAEEITFDTFCKLFHHDTDCAVSASSISLSEA